MGKTMNDADRDVLERFAQMMHTEGPTAVVSTAFLEEYNKKKTKDLHSAMQSRMAMERILRKLPPIDRDTE